MIELKGICKIYNRSVNDKPVLQDVNFKINRGDFVSIMGASGSGKTTLLNILGGLDDATGGEYIFEGKTVSGLNGKKTDLFRREKISLVFQKYELLDNLNVEKNVEIPL